MIKKIVKGFLAKGKFKGTVDYWESRYAAGGNSGSGSYKQLAEFKADFLNQLVQEEGIRTVIEFGCGDGNQLSLATYPNYIGLDVSPTAIQRCSSIFKSDPSKSFFLYSTLAFQDHHQVFSADLALSLDVLYHLVEDEIFHIYLYHLFNSGKQYVVIYSGDEANVPGHHDPHVRLRKFTDYVAQYFNEWKLDRKVKNKYSLAEYGPDLGSFADFYVYKKIVQ